MTEYAGKNVNLVAPPRTAGKGTFLCACCHLAKTFRPAEFCEACDSERLDPHSRYSRIGHCCA